MDVRLLALAGSIPIGTVFFLMVGLRWSAARAMATGWGVATALGIWMWEMEWVWWGAAALYGALQAFEIILIVFGAILLMNYLKRSGAIATIRWHFRHLAGDRRVQILLIGLGFETVMEGVAGFGTPGALAAPLLIGLGFPPLAAAVFGLYFDAPQPPFGAAGTPVIGGIGAVVDEQILAGEISLAQFLDQVTGWTGLITGTALAFWGILGIGLMIYWFGPKEQRTLRGTVRGIMPAVPFALLLGVLAGGAQSLAAWFLGPELPDIIAGFLVLAAGALMARKGILIPAQTWGFSSRETWPKAWLGGMKPEDLSTGEPHKEMPVLLAWTPYLIVTLVLLITRWPGLGLVPLLKSFALDYQGILGTSLDFSLRYLYLPGIMPFIPVAILTGFIHKMEFTKMADAWKESARQVLGPALTLIIAVSMTQVMIQSGTNRLDQPGMMEALSRVIADLAGRGVTFIAPWIGTIGTFMTGSSTSSNILFSVLQLEAGRDVGVSGTIMVALQNVGSGIGNMVSVLNIAAIGGVIGMTGREGDMLRKTIVPTILYAVFAGAAGVLLMALL